MGIARKIELYNQAFRSARQQISKDSDLTDRAGIVVQLHEAIRQQLLAGAGDAVAVAAGAILTLQAQRRTDASSPAG